MNTKCHDISHRRVAGVVLLMALTPALVFAATVKFVSDSTGAIERNAFRSPDGFQPSLSHPGVVFTANDGTLLEVSVKESTARGVRIYATSIQAGTPVIQARLGSAAGPVIAQRAMAA